MAKAGGTTLDKITDDPPESVPEPGGEQAAPSAPAPAATQPRTATGTPLPTSKTSTAVGLAHKVVALYGPAGVGKTTLASQWGGGDGLFFNCAGELGDLEVFQVPISSFREAKLLALTVKEKPSAHPCSIIDTADRLGQYCSDAVRRTLGISHESDAEYGKGWTLVRDEYSLFLSKLANIPNHGLILVTHSTEETIKTRNSEYTHYSVRGQKGIKESILDIADLVLFINFNAEDDEKRTIYTKPNRAWDAKERGATPRLPPSIDWPHGTNGFELLNDLWEKGAK